MNTQIEANPSIDNETKLYLIDTLEKLIKDIADDKLDKASWSWDRNTVPVLSPSNIIIGYKKEPKVFTCTIQYSSETEFIPVDPTTAIEE